VLAARSDVVVAYASTEPARRGVVVLEGIANVEQAKGWDGPDGEAWAADWEAFDDSLRNYRAAINAAAAVVDGERVLDVGCGNGQTSLDAAAATPTGSVLGVDLSGPMLERARERARAAGLRNVEFVQGDAQVHPFAPSSFDLAMSRFGSMFFADRVEAFTNIGRALRPGGRLLLIVWQGMSENEQFVTLMNSLSAGRELPTPPPGAPSPFALADPDIGRSDLEAAGFQDVQYESVKRPFVLTSDVERAVAFVRRNPPGCHLLADLAAAQQDAALDVLRAALEPRVSADGIQFDSATWFITARRP
jgi:SAM-dependent methyltransferase